MNSNQRSGGSAGFRSIVDEDAAEAFLREAPALPMNTVQQVANRTLLANNRSLINRVLAQEERNQDLANAGALDRLNTSVLHPNQSMGNLPLESPFRTIVPPFLGGQPAQPNVGTTESSIKSASDALNNIILRQAIQSQNIRASNALLGASQTNLNLHRQSVGGTEASRAMDNLLGNIVPSSMADARTAVALGIGASNIGNEVQLPTGPVPNLLSNVGQHNLLSIYNQGVRNSLTSQAFHQQPHGLSQNSDVLTQSEPQLQGDSAASQPSDKKQGRPATFLKQLHQMLLDLEEEPGGTSIASFVQQGHAFAIHQPEDFVKNVIPKYFRMSSLSSFQRQLNMYGFRQITSGPERGAYYHDRFVRGKPELLATMQRLTSSQSFHHHHHGSSQSSDALNPSELQMQGDNVASQPAMKRQGRPATFLKQLHQMLIDLEGQPGGTSIVSFVQRGRAFTIHRPEDFVKSVIPKYFRMSCLSSFQRQLNMYGFRQLTSGPERGAYYHDRFVRGQPDLLATIKRCRVNSKKKDPKGGGT